MRVIHGKHRWGHPKTWLHWCLWDEECRKYGCPRDIYIHPLGLTIRFSEGSDDPWGLLDGETKPLSRTRPSSAQDSGLTSGSPDDTETDATRGQGQPSGDPEP